jgi:hypothetical protein
MDLKGNRQCKFQGVWFDPSRAKNSNKLNKRLEGTKTEDRGGGKDKERDKAKVEGEHKDIMQGLEREGRCETKQR